MRKCFEGCSLLLLALGCATSGKVVKHRYTDNTYPFQISFPRGYDVVAYSPKSSKRVVAIQGKGKLTVYVKPMFIINVREDKRSLEEIVSKEREIHDLDEIYYVGSSIESESNVELGGHDAYLIHSSNPRCMALTVFAKFDDYFMKIEYLADPAHHSKEQYMEVMNSVVFNKH